MPPEISYFVAGGTLPPDSPSYVQRDTDRQLLELAMTGQFCYVLTARQMGKSSLMIRTARRLHEYGTKTAIIDLNEIGTEVTAEGWYFGLITHMKEQLSLPLKVETWWVERAPLGAVQRFVDFLRNVVLEEIEQPIVIFIDEIDVTLGRDFSSDFFAAIRSVFNARASDPTYNRLTFVLLGMATPSDLIKDRKRTPFNIGVGIPLREFDRDEAEPLRKGLQIACPQQGDLVFDRIFDWTKGHPYLTQRLCQALVDRDSEQWTTGGVDQLVDQLFFSDRELKDANLRSVRENVRLCSRRRRILKLYKDVYDGNSVEKDERSVDQNRLQLFGLVRDEAGALQVSNEIYRRVFGTEWIKANASVDWTQRLAIVSTVLVIILAAIIAFSIDRQKQGVVEARAQSYIGSFRGSGSSDVRINSLAELFGLPGYSDIAHRLYYEELSPTDQLAVFDLSNPASLGVQLTTVVEKLYAGAPNNPQGNAMLDAMITPLRKMGGVRAQRTGYGN